jgi:hypothetical protein
LSYSEAPQGFGNSQNTTDHSANKDMHLGPQNIMVFHDLEKAEAYAKEVNKPLFVDFTGHACVNCRKMEEKVWGEPGVIEILRDKLVIRLFPHEFGWCQSQRWLDRFPTIALENGIQSMASLAEKSRISISTYNATTYLESMSLNFPTIMFWNPNHWELRDSAQPYFEKLKSVGIFHETPESAARQMAQVWDDVSGWWQSAAVQTVRKEFCVQYAHIPEKPLDGMKSLFRTMADCRGAAVPGPLLATKPIND